MRWTEPHEFSPSGLWVFTKERGHEVGRKSDRRCRGGTGGRFGQYIFYACIKTQYRWIK